MIATARPFDPNGSRLTASQQLKVDRGWEIHINRERLQRVREAAARLQASLEAALEQERRLAPAYSGNSLPAGLLREVETLLLDLDLVVVK